MRAHSAIHSSHSSGVKRISRPRRSASAPESAAKPEALEAMPQAVGKVLAVTTSRAKPGAISAKTRRRNKAIFLSGTEKYGSTAEDFSLAYSAPGAKISG